MRKGKASAATLLNPKSCADTPPGLYNKERYAAEDRASKSPIVDMDKTNAVLKFCESLVCQGITYPPTGRMMTTKHQTLSTVNKTLQCKPQTNRGSVLDFV